RLAARLRDVARGLARGFGLVARGQRHAGAQKGRRQDLRTHGSTSLGLTGGSRGTAWEVGGARVVPSTPGACAPRSGGAGPRARLLCTVCKRAGAVRLLVDLERLVAAERRGLAEQPALPERDAEGAQRAQLLERVEALADDAGAEVARERLQRAQDRLPHGILVDAAHEGAVDLDELGRQLGDR